MRIVDCTAETSGIPYGRAKLTDKATLQEDMAAARAYADTLGVNVYVDGTAVGLAVITIKPRVHAFLKDAPPAQMPPTGEKSLEDDDIPF